jgi:hypothetical protein
LDSGVRPEFSLETYLESIYDDNAFRTATDAEGERQDRLGLDIAGEFDSGLNEWRFAYLVERQEFEDDSQESLTNAIGEARYQLGNESTWYALDIAHIVDQVLQAPDSDVTTSTIGDQQLFEFLPTVRTRQDRANHVYLTGIFRSVEFEADQRPDATDRGAEVGYVRLLSARSEAGLTASRSEIFSDDSAVEDFRNETARLFYEAESRKLEYKVSAGYQRFESLDSDFDDGAIIFGLNLQYRHLDSSFTASLNKSLTNTSFAQSVGDSATGAVVVAEGDSDDIIEVLDGQIRWATRSLCQRCQSAFELQFQDVDYKRQDLLDFEIISGAFLIDYRLSSMSTVSANISYRDTEFLEDPSRSAESRIIDFGYTRNFTERFSVAALYSWSDQEATLVNYDSNRFGVRLTKTFY